MPPTVVLVTAPDCYPKARDLAGVGLGSTGASAIGADGAHIVVEDASGDHYNKLLDEDGRAVICEVAVFPLAVRRQLKVWPEIEQREIRWVAVSEGRGADR